MVEGQRIGVETGIAGGTKVFSLDESVRQIAVIVKGNVRAANAYMEYVIPENNVIGLIDVRGGSYLFDYYAMEECTMIFYDIGDFDDLVQLEKINKDYQVFCARSAEFQMKELITVYRELKQACKSLYRGIKIHYEEYNRMCKHYMAKPIVHQEIEKLELEVPDEDDEFLDQQYVLHLMDLPMFVHKVFFESNSEILYFHLKLESGLATWMDERNRVFIQFFLQAQKLLFDTGINNLFSMYSKLAFSVLEAKGNVAALENQMQKVYELIRQAKDITEEVLGLEYGEDFSRVQDIFQVISTKDQQKNMEMDTDILLDYSRSAAEDAVAESAGTLRRLLEYSGMDEKERLLFERYLTVYRSLKDKTATDDDSRKLRKILTDGFYNVYEKVFFRAYEENNHERYIDVFLNFGCMDEQMLNQNNILDLYSDDVIGRSTDGNDDNNEQLPCVFTIRQWLTAIYEGRRKPSKNSFDLDYVDAFREKKKTEHFTEEEERAYMNDRKGMVSFEIRNMFIDNHRLTSRFLTAFCPIIKDDDFIQSPRKMRVRRSDVINTLKEITDVDFRAFTRDYMYENLEKKIPKMNVLKVVMPDVILMPSVGARGNMWQEISGKKRDTRGRFILPIFIEDDLKKVMTKLVGAFRWELCRTVQGTYWNDVRERSLTSEYVDYVQFYRKNRELSEEAKEKVKKQLISARNNTREMFVKDYEVWIANESLGLARLNKISRMILAAYCPFSKKYRDKIKDQPMFAEGVTRYERDKAKLLKELKARFIAIQNANGEIDEVLQMYLKLIAEN